MIPERKRFVVKCMDLPRISPRVMFCEIVGNLFAREIEVNTPRPALVSISDTFARVTNAILARDGLQISEGVGVGCEYFQGGFTSPVIGPPLAHEEVPQATLLYGFDLLVQNPDRRVDKANCGFLGQKLIAFDFEMAFSFLLLVGQQHDPWEVSKHGLASKHIFHRQLQQRQVSWTPLLDALASFDLELFREWEAGLPAAWPADMGRVIEHVRAVKRNLTKFEHELQGSLS